MAMRHMERHRTDDGEGEESRLARRKRNWIANVQYLETGI